MRLWRGSEGDGWSYVKLGNRACYDMYDMMCKHIFLEN